MYVYVNNKYIYLHIYTYIHGTHLATDSLQAAQVGYQLGAQLDRSVPYEKIQNPRFPLKGSFKGDMDIVGIDIHPFICNSQYSRSHSPNMQHIYVYTYKMVYGYDDMARPI